ncbi:NTF2-like protein [Obba rivulosa]|uniref:Nuclear transport factor 2 n=1 Tax=Obba rivulosa TaxID=1052685 RepID=A0A8E2AJ99_9APHY|nr:NTF2-like protein [Obba rivulosa]
MADINTVATQFTDFYYTSFDRDRASLGPLYRPESMLTFEGTQHQGTSSIVEKLQSLPFQSVQHKVTTLDAQPSTNAGAIIVSVTGLLVVDGSENPLQFSQVFQLVPTGGTYFIFNDIFRLNYGA